MNRYQDRSACDKRTDQIIGFWSFPVLNLIILFLTPAGREFILALLVAGALAGGVTTSSLGALPWIANAVFVSWALLFRPQVAVGYLVSLAGLIAGSLLYTISCLATCIMLQGIDPIGGGSELFLIAFPTVFWGVWLILGVVGSVRLYRKACGDRSDEVP
jgi:hypothetical protein